MTAWAFAEAVSWPLVPELLLAVLLLARPGLRRAAVLTACAAAASVAGCLTTYALASTGHAPPAPLTTARMHAVAAEQVRDEGAAAVRHQPWSGIPVKVYAAAAGRSHVDVGAFAAEVARARTTRLVTVACIAAALSMLVAGRAFTPFTGAAVVCFLAGLVRVVASWS
jgi:membrane protein YqaA with SNARE-associated domain